MSGLPVIDPTTQLIDAIRAQLAESGLPVPVDRNYRVFGLTQKAKDGGLTGPRRIVLHGVTEADGYSCLHGPDAFGACLEIANAVLGAGAEPNTGASPGDASPPDGAPSQADGSAPDGGAPEPAT